MTDKVPRILIVDDTAANLKLLQAIFEFERFSVTLAESGEAALAQAAVRLPDIALLDLRMPGMDGIETLGKLKAMAPTLPVIILTSHLEIAAAVEAIKLGAEDFLVRPIQSDHLVHKVRRTLERCELKAEVENLRHLVHRQGYLARLMTPSPQMREVGNSIRRVADSNFTVLIQGETGTGKELVARAIHQESPRADNPFIAIDAGAIPEALVESELFGYEKGAFSGADRRKDGHFQTAKGGTLFLDEVSNLPIASQPKLLRAIQERQVLPVGATRVVEVDARLIAASNHSLDISVSKGLFREDLYYRLAEFVIVLPPLRERREDILPLAQAFLGEATVELKRPASVITQARSRSAARLPLAGQYPSIAQCDAACGAADNERGNRRPGPRTVVANSFRFHPGAACDRSGRSSSAASNPAPDAVSNSGRSLKDIARVAFEAAEKQAITEALRTTGGHKQKAALLLQTDYKTLFVKLKRYGLGNPHFKME